MSRSRVYFLYLKQMGSHDFSESDSMTASRNTSANAGVTPRVFLSYARTDGEPFATQLRQRLEAVGQKFEFGARVVGLALDEQSGKKRVIGVRLPAWPGWPRSL